jgi:adenylosuccinate synthase
VSEFNASEFLDGNACVVGLQWGDEGKGKIVDFLTEHAEVVARYCGGANAGHSVRIGAEKYATHLLPVGVFRPGVMSVVGNGVVLDPAVLFREIDELTAAGSRSRRPTCGQLQGPPRDAVPPAGGRAPRAQGRQGRDRHDQAGDRPAYADKMHRTSAFRVADLLREDRLRERLEQVVADRNKVFRVLYDAPPMDWRETFEQYRAYGRRLAPFVDDVGHLLIGYAREGKRIVFEGAHAVLLDVDHGTYPYVTSSNCSALGLYTGAGVRRRPVRNFFGIMKAYSTRVGGGPFPTEQENATGQYIRERGNEYGTTTRRPRRCGWFDAMAVRYSVELCGITHVALTLLDVLSGLDHVRVCTGYLHKGARSTTSGPTWTRSRRSSRCTRRSPDGSRTSRRPAGGTTSRRRRSGTYRCWRNWSARRSAWSASGRSGRQRWCGEYAGQERSADYDLRVTEVTDGRTEAHVRG